MNRIRRKLVWLGITICSLLITLTSTTYAFIVLDREAKVSEVDFNIENQDGLLLSLDGKNFYQDLSYDMIIDAIERYQATVYGSKDNLEYSKFNLTGVTMMNSTDDDYKGLVDRNIEYTDYLENKSYRVKFATDLEVLDNEASAERHHELVPASKGSYVAFDLWCKVETNGIANENLLNYELYFSPRTQITGVTNTVNLVNQLTSLDHDKIAKEKELIAKENESLVEGQEAKSFVLSKEHYMSYYTVFEDQYQVDDNGDFVLVNGEKVLTAKKNTTIDVNPVNAMRIAVLQHLDVETQEANGFDNTELFVFEPYEGLGSSAIQSAIGVAGKELNDPNLNAMFTYYNNTHPLSPFGKAADDSDQFNTIHANEMYSTSLGSFVSVEGEYNVVKLTVMIYLDGWDADYFMGINTNDLKVRLGFEIKEK